MPEEWINYLLMLDHQWFEWVNSGLSHPFLDTLLPALRNKIFWIPLYLFLLIFVGANYPKRSLLLFLFGSLGLILISDGLSSHIIKPFFDRARPCQIVGHFEDFHLLVHCGSGKSFTSSHATNHFAFAIFWGCFFQRDFQLALVSTTFWAFIISFSQVYVGVHYPLDVICGAILGAALGYMMHILLKRTFRSISA